VYFFETCSEYLLIKGWFCFWNRIIKIAWKLSVNNFLMASSSTGVPESIFDFMIHTPRFTRIVLKYKSECLY